MPWLKVHYSPGFQEDLTSWSLVIESSGKIMQVINVYRFSPSESRTDSYESSLSHEQMLEIRGNLETLDFAAIQAAADTLIVDDVEQILVEVEIQGGTAQFYAPLDYWQWQSTRGGSLLAVQSRAIAFWQSLLQHSKHRDVACDSQIATPSATPRR